MDFVEFQPLIDGQRAKNRVVEHLSAAEFFARAPRRFIEPHEIAAHRIDHRIQIELTGREDVFWRLAPLWKKTKSNQRELLHTLFE